MKARYLLFFLLLAAACTPKARSLTILTTDDVHGAWFDSTYVGDRTRPSLMALNWYVDSIRKADGAKNVLLIDAGDCLQGDNAAYYYNYVDTTGEHLFTRLSAYMKYDAVSVGNHDIETGHAVYDRVTAELGRHGIPFLGGNAIRNDDGRPYFPLYKTFRRGGFKVLVLGYTNPNMAAWLDESIWSGMTFKSLIPLVQEDVDSVKAKERPDVTIVCIHSGTGKGDGSILESQALDLYKTLSGVDFVVCAHDHSQVCFHNDTIALINTGNRARYLGVGRISVGPNGEKTLGTELIWVDKKKTDPVMREAFRKDYEAVKTFTLQKVGVLSTDLYTRDSYSGMCPYINLVHRVQLEGAGAQVSFAAPLTYNGTVRAGELVYNDMFTIYPYENQLFKLALTGKEIKDYLEYSYGLWLADPGSDHVLRIRAQDDPRNNQARWSFAERTYNFDSAAGLIYTVDIRKPAGERVDIKSMADGTPFSPDSTYSVAMTSYRANGGGGTIIEGAGLSKDEIESRIMGRYAEIRELIYRYIKENMILDEDLLSGGAAIGRWEFIPSAEASDRIEDDMMLLFGK